MIPENVNRKIDNLGRVTLPKGLRQRMSLNSGDSLSIYTMEYNGEIFICLKKEEVNEDGV